MVLVLVMLLLLILLLELLLLLLLLVSLLLLLLLLPLLLLLLPYFSINVPSWIVLTVADRTHCRTRSRSAIYLLVVAVIACLSELVIACSRRRAIFSRRPNDQLLIAGF